MSDKRDELEMTEELFGFLQGVVPDGYKIHPEHVPNLTPDQAWTVVWYLGNLFWQVKDYIDRCDVCGELYDTHREGACLDFGDAPYHFCDGCIGGEGYVAKTAQASAKELSDHGLRDEIAD